MKRVYVAGPMRGIAKHNFPAFDKAAEILRGNGFTVINPADLDRQEGLTEKTTEVTNDMLRRCMMRDMEAICGCTHIALLLGWQKSRGVRPEAVLAYTLGLEFLIQAGDKFLPCPGGDIVSVVGQCLQHRL